MIKIFLTLLFIGLSSTSHAFNPMIALPGRPPAGGVTEYTVYITDNTSDFNSIDYSEVTVYTGSEMTWILETNFRNNSH
jgi:hypothetical protein